MWLWKRTTELEVTILIVPEKEDNRITELEEENDELQKKMGLKLKIKNHFDIILNLILIFGIIGFFAYLLVAFSIIY